MKEIIEATGGRIIYGSEDIAVEGIATDTRTISPGELFIALIGEHFDGHNFVEEAFKKGAKAAVINRDSPHLKSGISSQSKWALSLIKVDDTRKALGDIASFYRKKLNIKIAGITGSNGKTTTKDMIAYVLSKKYKVAKTHDTENNLIGVPLTILKIRNESYAVIELGTNTPGEIDYLAKITRPDVGLITNIGPAHLEGLGSQKNILKEKSRLFTHLEKDGIAVINKDDSFLSSLKISSKTLTFGMDNKKCDYCAGKIIDRIDGVEFILNKKYKFRLQVFGAHNVYNALAAIAVCSALGLDIKLSQRALLDFKPARMRFDILKLDGINIINDSYNSNPASMKAAVQTLSNMKTKGRKIVVAADMLELGKDTEKLHYQTGKMVAESAVDILITVGELSVNMVKGAKDNGMDDNRVRAFSAHKEAARYLTNIKRAKDTILVKGSRAMKMEEFVRCFTTSCIR